MRKFYAFLAFIPAIISFSIATYFIFDVEPVSQFKDHCVDISEYERACAKGSTTFRGKSALDINPNFYPGLKAFWIVDTISSSDCSRIERAIKESFDDQPLKKYFEVHLEVCKYEVENGKRSAWNSIQSGPFVPEEFYKDYYDNYLRLFPEGTIFDKPKEYA